MSSVQRQFRGVDALSASQPLTIGRTTIATLHGVALGLAIVAASIVAGLGYHLVVHNTAGPISSFMLGGSLAAVLFLLPRMYRDDLGIEALLGPIQPLTRQAWSWLSAIFTLLVIGMLTKTTADHSRGWVILFMGLGLAGVVFAELVARALAQRALATGLLATRRVMVIGTRADLAAFKDKRQDLRSGIRIVGEIAIDGAIAPARDGTPGVTASEHDGEAEAATRQRRIDRALHYARKLGVEDVVILADTASLPVVEAWVDAFALLPVEIHLSAGALMQRFAAARVARIGPTPVLTVASHRLSSADSFAKRAFDIAAAGFGLIALAPVFLVVAILIKRDTAGPVFFRQRRRGYNQRPFRIWKFRTMTTMDDGATVVQAKKNDPRVTRIGAYLRRYNIDELPQLINVLMGEMSIVGPRPHALAHDQDFEQRISSYRRRLNVKPGITGWAQINGHRGETDTDDKMRARVAHDLHYIDNWSLPLDCYIVMMTVLSGKAYRNAH